MRNPGAELSDEDTRARHPSPKRHSDRGHWIETGRQQSRRITQGIEGAYPSLSLRFAKDFEVTG